MEDVPSTSRSAPQGWRERWAVRIPACTRPNGAGAGRNFFSPLAPNAHHDDVRRMADLEFRFTIEGLPDGTALTAEELEQFILAKLEDSAGTSKQALWDLACLYSQTGRNDRALDCIH